MLWVMPPDYLKQTHLLLLNIQTNSLTKKKTIAQETKSTYQNKDKTY